MNENLVSIIIPTHNRAELLRRALRSVLNQTYQDFEVIIADDGSVDHTEAIVKALQDSRIHYFKLNKVGRSAARNFALRKAKGNWISFLDSDDEFCPDKLEKQIELLKRMRQFQLCYTRGRVIDENNKNLVYEDMYRADRTGDLYYDIALYRPLTILLPSVLLSRELFEKVGFFDESLDRFEDTDYWRRCARITPFVGIDVPLVNIFSHSGNQMENPKIILDHLKRYITKVLNEDSQRYTRARLLSIAARFVNHYAVAVLFNRKYWFASLGFTVFSFKLKPSLPETWCNFLLAFIPRKLRLPLLVRSEHLFHRLRHVYYVFLKKTRTAKRLLSLKPKT